MICYDRYSFERDAYLPTDGKGDRQLRCIITIIPTIVLYQIFLDDIKNKINIVVTKEGSTIVAVAQHFFQKYRMCSCGEDAYVKLLHRKVYKTNKTNKETW